MGKTRKPEAAKPVQCGCGKTTCGVGKTHAQLNQDFLDWAGDTPASRDSNRRWTHWGKLAAAGRL